MSENKEIELRSDEVQEILSQVPNWMIRWGTFLLFGIILMLFFVSWFIKYPDIVSAQIVITTVVPPENVVARTSGKIETLLVNDKDIVQVDSPLAIIQNTANYNDVLLLKNMVKSHSNGKNFDFEKLKNKQLGDIESAYSKFYSAYIENELNSKLQPFNVEDNAHNSENIQIRERLNILKQKKELNQIELQLKKNVLNRYETLLDKGVISIQDFENKRLEYLQIEQSYKNVLSGISELKSSLIDNYRTSKGNKISGTKEEVTLNSNKIQSFYQLEKAIKEWELAYVLKASIDGKVSFLQIWTVNQTISAGDNVFSIVPVDVRGYIGKLKAPALNAGKIKIGQQVNIRLDNFPDREFGILKGEIQNISLVPDKEGNLFLDVALPKGLLTSYHKTIEFRQEMGGSAEIVTEDLRLTQRLLYQFHDFFKR